jgi:uncharacterized membrane protein
MNTHWNDVGTLLGNNVLPSVHAGHGEGGGLVALIDHLLAALTHDQPSSWSLLGGIEALGPNLHPLFLHFPIAFLSGFLLLEIYGLAMRKQEARKLASSLIYLGAVGAIVTAASGLIAAETVPHGSQVHEIMEWHQRAGLTVCGLSVMLALWRRFSGIPASAMANTFSLLITSIIAVVLFLGADMGGMMVYKHGVGVKSLQSTEEHQHHTHE